MSHDVPVRATALRFLDGPASTRTPLHNDGFRGTGCALGTWHEVGAIDPVEFVPGLLMRPVVGDGAMVNFVTYEPGTAVPMRAHEEERVTFVLEGEFEFELNGETRTVRPGMAAHIPANVPHAARTLETSCSQVDVFAPPRKVLLDALAAMRTV